MKPSVKNTSKDDTKHKRRSTRIQNLQNPEFDTKKSSPKLPSTSDSKPNNETPSYNHQIKKPVKTYKSKATTSESPSNSKPTIEKQSIGIQPEDVTKIFKIISKPIPTSPDIKSSVKSPLKTYMNPRKNSLKNESFGLPDVPLTFTFPDNITLPQLEAKILDAKETTFEELQFVDDPWYIIELEESFTNFEEIRVKQNPDNHINFLPNKIISNHSLSLDQEVEVYNSKDTTSIKVRSVSLSKEIDNKIQKSPRSKSFTSSNIKKSSKQLKITINPLVEDKSKSGRRCKTATNLKLSNCMDTLLCRRKSRSPTKKLYDSIDKNTKTSNGQKNIALNVEDVKGKNDSYTKSSLNISTNIKTKQSTLAEDNDMKGNKNNIAVSSSNVKTRQSLSAKAKDIKGNENNIADSPSNISTNIKTKQSLPTKDKDKKIIENNIADSLPNIKIKQSLSSKAKDIKGNGNNIADSPSNILTNNKNKKRHVTTEDNKNNSVDSFLNISTDIETRKRNITKGNENDNADSWLNISINNKSRRRHTTPKDKVVKSNIKTRRSISADNKNTKINEKNVDSLLNNSTKNKSKNVTKENSDVKSNENIADSSSKTLTNITTKQKISTKDKYIKGHKNSITDSLLNISTNNKNERRSVTKEDSDNNITDSPSKTSTNIKTKPNVPIKDKHLKGNKNNNADLPSITNTKPVKINGLFSPKQTRNKPNLNNSDLTLITTRSRSLDLCPRINRFVSPRKTKKTANFESPERVTRSKSSLGKRISQSANNLVNEDLHPRINRSVSPRKTKKPANLESPERVTRSKSSMGKRISQSANNLVTMDKNDARNNCLHKIDKDISLEDDMTENEVTSIFEDVFCSNKQINTDVETNIKDFTDIDEDINDTIEETVNITDQNEQINTNINDHTNIQELNTDNIKYDKSNKEIDDTVTVDKDNNHTNIITDEIKTVDDDSKESNKDNDHINITDDETYTDNVVCEEADQNNETRTNIDEEIYSDIVINTRTTEETDHAGTPNKNEYMDITHLKEKIDIESVDNEETDKITNKGDEMIIDTVVHREKSNEKNYVDTITNLNEETEDTGKDNDYINIVTNLNEEIDADIGISSKTTKEIDHTDIINKLNEEIDPKNVACEETDKDNDHIDTITNLHEEIDTDIVASIKTTKETGHTDILTKLDDEKDTTNVASEEIDKDDHHINAINNLHEEIDSGVNVCSKTTKESDHTDILINLDEETDTGNIFGEEINKGNHHTAIVINLDKEIDTDIVVSSETTNISDHTDIITKLDEEIDTSNVASKETDKGNDHIDTINNLHEDIDTDINVSIKTTKESDHADILTKLDEERDTINVANEETDKNNTQSDLIMHLDEEIDSKNVANEETDKDNAQTDLVIHLDEKIDTDIISSDKKNKETDNTDILTQLDEEINAAIINNDHVDTITNINEEINTDIVDNKETFVDNDHANVITTSNSSKDDNEEITNEDTVKDLNSTLMNTRSRNSMPRTNDEIVINNIQPVFNGTKQNNNLMDAAIEVKEVKKGRPKKTRNSAPDLVDLKNVEDVEIKLEETEGQTEKSLNPDMPKHIKLVKRSHSLGAKQGLTDYQIPKFNPKVGDIAWAQIGKHPFWPCIITREPVTKDFKKTVIKRVLPMILYHVRFFGDNGRRAWIYTKKLMKFRSKEDLKNIYDTLKEVKPFADLHAFYIKENLIKKWTVAVEEAEHVKSNNFNLKQKIDYLEISTAKIQEVKSATPTIRKRKRSIEENQTKKKIKLDAALAQEMEDIKPDTNELLESLKPDKSPQEPIKLEEIIVKDEIMDTEYRISVDSFNHFGSYSLEDQRALFKRNSLFKGIPKDKVCQFCFNFGDIYKCKGGCNGIYHLKCAMQVLVDKVPKRRKIVTPTIKIENTDNTEAKKNDKQESTPSGSLFEVDENHVQIITVPSSVCGTPPRKTFPPDFVNMSLAERIDFKMNEIMKKFETTAYLDKLNESMSDEKSSSSPSSMKKRCQDLYGQRSKEMDVVSKMDRSPASVRQFEQSLERILKPSLRKHVTADSPSDSPASSNQVERAKKRSKTKHVTADSSSSSSNENANLPKHTNGARKSLLKHVTADNDGNELDYYKNINPKHFKCGFCTEDIDPYCFICHDSMSKEGSHIRQKCSLYQCSRFYHPECLKLWPQTQWSLIQTTKNRFSQEEVDSFVCPQHVCHTCASEDPRAAMSRCSGDKIVKCLCCPTSYHSTNLCVPAGTEIITSTQILCPKHRRKTKYQTINTTWCFLCNQGGDLICCETCPTSVHPECMYVNLTDDDKFICEDCESGRLPLYDEIVWVKVGQYKWWPGLVLFPNEIPPKVLSVKHSQGEFVVKFFGTYDHYWVNRGRSFLFQEGDTIDTALSAKNKVKPVFKKAVEEAVVAHKMKKQFKAIQVAETVGTLKPPPFIKIKVSRPVGNVKLMDLDLSNTTSCECEPSQPNPCGPDSNCLNRILWTECNPEVCPAGHLCQNQSFEKREYPLLVPYKTEARGWGLKSLEPIKKGQFVIEYVGELIDDEEYQRRIQKMQAQKEENYYFLTIHTNRMIDAGPKGNIARFMNHCCQPNCETQKWTVNGETRVGLFATEDIPAHTELTFNYNLECTGTEKKVCKCGAPNCSGFIGLKAKQEATEPKKPKKPYARKREPVKAIILPPCFICQKNGDVAMCNNKICTKAYHLECLKLEEWPEGKKFVCPWHYCNTCSKRTIRCCVKCLNSFCPTHSEGNVRYDNLMGFVCNVHEPMKPESASLPARKKRSTVTFEDAIVTSTTDDDERPLVVKKKTKRSKNVNNCTSTSRVVDEMTVSSATASDFEDEIRMKRKRKKQNRRRKGVITANFNDIA